VLSCLCAGKYEYELNLPSYLKLTIATDPRKEIAFKRRFRPMRKKANSQTPKQSLGAMVCYAEYRPARRVTRRGTPYPHSLFPDQRSSYDLCQYPHERPFRDTGESTIIGARSGLWMRLLTVEDLGDGVSCDRRVTGVSALICTWPTYSGNQETQLQSCSLFLRIRECIGKVRSGSASPGFIQMRR
jgi:hypothetical protein